jgi:hypothetical protein
VSDITLTVFAPKLEMKTSPFALSYAASIGFAPTVTVATTLLDESDMTLTLFAPKLEMKTSPFALSYARPWGPGPART